MLRNVLALLLVLSTGSIAHADPYRSAVRTMPSGRVTSTKSAHAMGAREQVELVSRPPLTYADQRNQAVAASYLHQAAHDNRPEASNPSTRLQRALDPQHVYQNTAAGRRDPLFGGSPGPSFNQKMAMHVQAYDKGLVANERMILLSLAPKGSKIENPDGFSLQRLRSGDKNVIGVSEGKEYLLTLTKHGQILWTPKGAGLSPDLTYALK